PVRGEPAFPARAGRHGVVRPCGLFRARRLRRRAARAARRAADGSRVAARAPGRVCWRSAVRLVLRAPLRHLPRHAHAGVRADRLVDRVPVGHAQRRLQRPDRHLACLLAGLAHRVLPGDLVAMRPGDRRGLALDRLAVRPCAARESRLAAARQLDRHRRARPAMDRVHHRRRLCRAGGEPVRIFQGLDLSGDAVGAALGRCTGDGSPWRRADRDRAGVGRGAFHLARGRGVARRGVLACRDRRGDPAAGARLPHRCCRRGEKMALAVTRLSKAYGGVEAVRDVSFDVAAGEMVALIGPNGAGKTTCFNILNGQLSPDAGDVRLDGTSLLGLPPHRIWRLGVGRTFQVTATFASMSVRENVQAALLSHHRRNYSMWMRAGNYRVEEADALLERVGMREQAARPCAELAYGDLKRVELALALANDPRLLLMDEPTAGMAPEERGALMQLAAALARDHRLAVLFTEHDMSVVFGFATRVIVLHLGKVIAAGTPEAVRADPRVREVYLGDA